MGVHTADRPESAAMLLGLFQVSILHNVVHVGFGVVGLAMVALGLATRRSVHSRPSS